MFSPAELDRLADAIVERLEARGFTSSTAHDGLVDVHGAAKLLGCSVPTVERWAKSGEIPSVKVGRLRRYDPKAIKSPNEKGGVDRA